MTDFIAPLAAVSASEMASPEAAGVSPRSSHFGEMLMSGLESASQQSAVASDKLANYAAGNPVSPHELMIAMEQARMAVQLTVEIRNRLVEAYQEVARMQI